MKFVIMLVLVAFAPACVPENYPVTYPPDATTCRSNGDCPGTQYCGFMPGYTAAICRGDSAGSTWGDRNATGFRLNSR